MVIFVLKLSLKLNSDSKMLYTAQNLLSMQEKKKRKKKLAFLLIYVKRIYQ